MALDFELNSSLNIKPSWQIVWESEYRIGNSVRLFELAKSRRVTVVHTTPSRSKTAFASEVLAALGKSAEHLPSYVRNMAVEAARMWLRAERVEELVVYGVESLDGLEDVLGSTDARLWMVCRTKLGAIQMASGQTEVRDLEFMFQTLESLPRIDEEEEASKDPEDFPRVPFNDFLTFVSSCKRMYEGGGQELDQILACFREQVRITSHEFLPRINDLPVDWVTGQVEEVGEFIRETMMASSSIREAVCRLRAIQCALFMEWVFVKVDLMPLLALWHLDTSTGHHAEISQVGRKQVDPRPGFLATLAHATDLTGGQIIELRREDIADDGTKVTAEGKQIEIPPDLQVFARAYLDQYDSSTELPPNRPLFHSKKGYALRSAGRLLRLKSMDELEKSVRLAQGGYWNATAHRFNEQIKVRFLTKSEPGWDLPDGLETDDLRDSLSTRDIWRDLYPEQGPDDHSGRDLEDCLRPSWRNEPLSRRRRNEYLGKGKPDQVTGADDASTLGALLTTIDRPLWSSTLIRSLGWGFDRFHEAKEMLADRLPTVGLCLHEFLDESVQIRPLMVRADASLIMNDTVARKGISDAEATLVRHLVTHPVSWTDHTGIDRPLGIIRRLIDAGMIEPHGQKLQLTGRVLGGFSPQRGTKTASVVD